MVVRLKGSLRILLAMVFAGVAAASGGKALYLTAKAELAQWLLVHAWNQGKLDQEATVPWPWADTFPVAVLNVSSLDITQIVMNSLSGEAMSFGPGLLAVEGGYVLSGHRDSHFRFLKDLSAGDRISIEHLSGRLEHYEVESFAVQDIRLNPDIQPQPDAMTLVTCYPFDGTSGNTNFRYIVEARKTT